MSSLQIEISIAALVLLILIFSCLIKNRMSIKNSIAWLLLPIAFFLITIFPEPLDILSKRLGFETLANFIFLIINALLILICFFLTINSSHQQNQITKLIQEIAILKHRNNQKEVNKSNKNQKI